MEETLDGPRESTIVSDTKSTQSNGKSEKLNFGLVIENRLENGRAGSLARLGHLLDVQKVAGSNPARPTMSVKWLNMLEKMSSELSSKDKYLRRFNRWWADVCFQSGILLKL